MVFRSTIRKLESYLRRCGSDLSEIERVLPLTPLQEAMVAEMVASDYKRYYNHDVMRLTPNVDMEKLGIAWRTVLHSSPILRTKFIPVDDPNISSSFAQVILGQSHDLYRYSDTDQEPNFATIFEDIRQVALETIKPAPLFNIRVIRTPGGTFPRSVYRPCIVRWMVSWSIASGRTSRLFRSILATSQLRTSSLQHLDLFRLRCCCFLARQPVRCEFDCVSRAILFPRTKTWIK